MRDQSRHTVNIQCDTEWREAEEEKYYKIDVRMEFSCQEDMLLILQ